MLFLHVLHAFESFLTCSCSSTYSSQSSTTLTLSNAIPLRSSTSLHEGHLRWDNSTMATQLFASIFRRAPQVPSHAIHFPYNIKTNPYVAKKPWPPDFTQLSPKHQFRLERRYRRRTKLKWARPNWHKGIKLAQWGSIIFVVVYGVLFLEVRDGKDVGPGLGVEGRGRSVFDGIREWYWGQMDGFRGVREGQGQRKVVTKESPSNEGNAYASNG
jgi:hypothetical protein